MPAFEKVNDLWPTLKVTRVKTDYGEIELSSGDPAGENHELYIFFGASDTEDYFSFSDNSYLLSVTTTEQFEKLQALMAELPDFVALLKTTLCEPITIINACLEKIRAVGIEVMTQKET